MLVILISIFASCKSSKELANKFYDKAKDKDLPTVAERTREDFPCIVTSTKSDSTQYKAYKNKFDSINALYAAQQSLPPLTPDTVRLKDSANCPSLLTEKNYWKKEVSKKDQQIKDLNEQISNIKPIHDTARVEDSAKIFGMAHIIQTQDERNNKITAANATLQEKISVKNKWMLWLIIACVILALLNYIQFKISR